MKKLVKPSMEEGIVYSCYGSEYSSSSNGCGSAMISTAANIVFSGGPMLVTVSSWVGW